MTTRDLIAKDAAMRQYAITFDELAELQQSVSESLPGLAAEAGKVAFVVLRAYQAELRDPVPEGLRA